MRLSLLLALVFQVSAFAALPQAEAERIADAIYRVEGGSKTRHPYGILSVKTSNPRKVCLRTIQNNHTRWIKAGRPGLFLDYLADRYCPLSADPVGNRNWKRNIKLMLK
jgi:hypothetical protein